MYSYMDKTYIHICIFIYEVCDITDMLGLWGQFSKRPYYYISLNSCQCHAEGCLRAPMDCEVLPLLATSDTWTLGELRSPLSIPWESPKIRGPNTDPK